MKREKRLKPPRLGSLCTGYGGLDMAVLAVFGVKLSWMADNDRHVAAILAARYPGVPNLGDLTALTWGSVPGVDIICAGFPCQDISFSGKGAGIEKGERSGIWRNIVQGIRVLRPKLIVVENVAAIRSRGISRVLGDLAEAGYDAVWTSLRASDVGAVHRRERVFILGYRRQDEKTRHLVLTSYARSQRRTRRPTRREAPGWWASGGSERLGYLAVSGEQEQRERRLQQQEQAEPARPDGQAPTYSPGQQRGAWGVDADRQETPGVIASSGRETDQGRVGSVGAIAWGRYEAAIRRWGQVTGRAAPAPTEVGTKDQVRLSAAFSEWLMGLPRGFVTGLGLPYSAQHRAIGNGVVPQQAVEALRQLVGMAAGAMPSERHKRQRDHLNGGIKHGRRATIRTSW